MAEANADPREKDLKFKRENQYWRFYDVDDIGQEDNPNPSTETLFWYSAIVPAEYDYLNANNQFPESKDYGGIANNYKYCDIKYMKNKKEENRIVEFRTTENLYEYFTKNKINPYKIENGGISYGLGDTGNKPKGKPLQLFNELMKSDSIIWRVVGKKEPPVVIQK